MSFKAPGIIGATLLMVGVAYGRLHPGTSVAMVRPSPAPEVPRRDTNVVPSKLLCKGGMSPRVQVLVEPDGTTIPSQAAPFAASITLSNLSEREASLAYQVEIVSDTGKIAFTGAPSDTRRVSPMTQQLAETLQLPKLPDGYFQVRVTAAGLVENKDATALGALYVQSSQGAIRVLDVNQFLAESGANVANQETVR